MNRLALILVLLGGVAACMPEDKSAAPKAAPADLAAGKAIAERECKGCHGAEGKSIAPAIPHLAAQRERYLVTAIQEYKQAKRVHAALRDIAAHMSDADARNIAAYYASLPPVKAAPAKPGEALSPFEHGKQLAQACAKCHGADGNSQTSGIPNLSGQQPRYLVVAIQEYLARERKSAPMHGLLPGLKKRDMESLALYFASQTPAPRDKAPFGDPAAGEPLTAVCGGCHGQHGISLDASTPSLAAQDPRYLVEAIKAYRTTRSRESMREYVRALNDRDIDNIAAFYAVQKSRPSEQGQTLVQDLVDKCERCHGDAAAANPAVMVPKIAGQDRDYLIMALRAYRDDRRESTTMHRMSLPYSDSIIESLAAAYAAQPAK
jgi:cytochrome c553